MQIDESRAAYRVLNPAPTGFFGPDDHLYQYGDCIYFDGEPNEEMEPLNTLAKERMNKFLEKLDKLAQEAAAKLGKAFAGRARSLDGALEIASEVQRSGISVMGVKKEAVESIARIDASPVPETGGDVRRRPGRPPKGKGNLTISEDTIGNIKNVA